MRAKICACREAKHELSRNFSRLQAHLKYVDKVVESTFSAFAKCSVYVHKLRKENIRELFQRFLPLKIAVLPPVIDYLLVLSLLHLFFFPDFFN